jgi:flagellar hook-associated protein 3 FlgL
MRVTNNMLIDRTMYYMNNNLNRLQKVQDQLSTGKKIEVPSDDPVVAAKALQLRTDVSQVEQFKKNATDAYSWMDTTEGTLSNLTDILQRARELAVQGANGTLTPNDRDAINQEVKQLKAQAINMANSTYAGRYIFSGYATDTKLMNDDGTYNASVSSNETAVVKGGLVNLATTNIDTSINSSFRVSVDGTNYYDVVVSPAKTYDGVTPGLTLDDLAKDIQTSLSTSAAASGDPNLPNIKVVNNGGRIEFSLKNTLDANGNRLKIYLKNGDSSGANDILSSINVKTDPVTSEIVSKSEDINFQVGISDPLNVNVPGTDLFGTGVKGDMGSFMVAFNRFIDSLGYPDDNNSYISSDTLTATSSNSLDLTAGYQFSMTVNGVTQTVNMPIKNYDGSTGNTIDDLATDMTLVIQGADPAFANVTVQNQNGKLLISDPPTGSKITLTEGPPNADALGALRIYTDSNKTVSSTTSTEGINNSITNMDNLVVKVTSIRSDVGARMNRAELTQNRLDADNVNFTKLMSDNEDVDMAETITNMTNEQNVYRASLGAAGRIIMPTLIDFLK